ncbi:MULTISPECIES: hypothetical protein [unclassified Tenacibaculum]|uniref:hypothetical protein n=1 Tax=unclassified Tenacibaculum TaxID=2635139 RepID=UPI001F21B087|nr:MULTISPECIES: hypothetical protein [unclassified Tenacibaculum]MCF2875952.1 hypothetical protein [Tenacibaculum sp. Cn5-1]MCF2936027.1 hypothetical protein [Tenacibaculum sp. Cn5-34]MCG7512588.1 hypothetical protein [Tenacibaculum sp. Cn5-46]
MKKIKLSIYILLLSLGFVSCESETTDPVEGIATATEQIVIGFSDTNLKTTVLENGGTATYQVSLSKPLPVDGVVVFDITSSDGSTESTSGVGEVSYGEVKIPAGETSATVTFTFADDTVADAEEIYNVSIKNLSVSTTLIKYFITLNNKSSERTINVYDTLPLVVEVPVGDMDIVLDWPGSEDLDLYLRSEAKITSTVIANSWFSQPEEVTITQALADGDYFLGLDNYDIATPYNIPCTLSLNFSGGKSEVLLTSLETTATAAANGEPDIWYKINKVTYGSKVTYTIIKL